MSTSYIEIMDILSGIESELGLPSKLLKKIYDKEKDVVYMGNRSSILEDIEVIIRNEFKEFVDTKGKIK